MNEEALYQSLVARMQEVAILPPQTMGPFTGLYKRFVPYMKWHPWRSVGAFSLFTAILLYLLFGVRLIRLASLLQYGF